MKIISFFKISNQEKLLFFEALFLIAIARVAVRFYPFKRLAGILGEHSKEVPEHELSIEEKRYFRKFSRAIERAAKVSFWRTVCYEKALTAKMMFKRRGIDSTIYIGMMRKEEDNKLEGHAWIRTGNIIVTGQTDFSKYVIVGIFS